MRLLKPGDSIAFSNETLDLGLGVPVSRNLKADQRSPWPDGNPPDWAAVRRELEVSRSSTFLLSSRHGRQTIDILAGRLILHTNIGDDKRTGEKMLWLNGLRYGSCFERKRFVVGGQPLRHLGIFLDDPQTLRRENKFAPAVAPLLQLLKPSSDEQTGDDTVVEEPLADGELRLLDALTAFVDAEYELEQLAAQREASYHYHKVVALPGRSRFKTLLRISLADADFRRFVGADPPISLVAVTPLHGEPVVLDLERTDSENGATDLIVSTAEQAGKLSLPPSGSLTRAALDVTRRVRLDAVDRLRQRKAANPWLIQIGASTREAKAFQPQPQRAPGTLNPSQREAVGKGLATPDIALVLGPPGTGKTTVIHSWVEQFVRAGKRVLVTSQNNKAVDNVLERLKRDEGLKCVRLGNEAKVMDCVRDLLIDNRAPALQKELLGDIDKATAALAELLALLQALGATDDQTLLADEAMRDRRRLDGRLAGSAAVLTDILGAMRPRILDAHRVILAADTQASRLRERARTREGRPGLLGLLQKGIAWIERHRARQVLAATREQAIAVKASYVQARRQLTELGCIVHEWQQALAQIRQQDLYPMLIRLVDVVGATCIGVSTNKHFSDVDFDVVIVDESAQIQLHNLIVPLAKAPQAILVGDHKQLPPVVQDDLLQEIARRNETALFPYPDELLRKSWFEIAWDLLPASHRATLDTQFRCPSVISDFISAAFYENRYFAGEAMKKKVPVLPAFSSCMVFVDTSVLPPAQRAERTRTVEQRQEVVGNPCETRILLALLKLFCEQLPDVAAAGEIGIIVPYKNHVNEVQRRIEEERRKGAFAGLRTPTAELVASVDSYQGQERDIILFAFTRSNPAGAVGFLTDWRRLNVAMTRTKRQLVMVGDLSTLASPARSAREREFKEAMRLLRDHLARDGQILAPAAIEGLP